MEDIEFAPIESCPVILRGVTGSHAYGLATPESDVDMKAVAVKPTSEFLGLVKPRVDQLTKETIGTDVDVVVHEVGKFIGLCVKSNPTASELLWLDDYDVLTHEGKQLIELRELFLSQESARNSYLGYTKAQVELMARRGVTLKRIHKASRHALRMMEQGATLWRTGQIVMRVRDPEQLRVQALRAVDDPTILDDGLARLANIIATESTPLREQADIVAADDVVRQIRMNHLAD